VHSSYTCILFAYARIFWKLEPQIKPKMHFECCIQSLAREKNSQDRLSLEEQHKMFYSSCSKNTCGSHHFRQMVPVAVHMDLFRGNKYLGNLEFQLPTIYNVSGLPTTQLYPYVLLIFKNCLYENRRFCFAWDQQ